MAYSPLGARVVVKVAPTIEKTKGGILMPGVVQESLHVGPVWATVIVAFCSGLVQLGYNLQGPVTMMISMLLGFLLAIPPALVTLATGSTWPGFLGYLFMVQLRQLEEVFLALLLLAYIPVFWVPLVLVALVVFCWYGVKAQG